MKRNEYVHVCSGGVLMLSDGGYCHWTADTERVKCFPCTYRLTSTLVVFAKAVPGEDVVDDAGENLDTLVWNK